MPRVAGESASGLALALWARVPTAGVSTACVDSWARGAAAAAAARAEQHGRGDDRR